MYKDVTLLKDPFSELVRTMSKYFCLRSLNRLLQLFEVIFYTFFRNGTLSRKRSDKCASDIDFRGLVQWLKLMVIFASIANLRFELVGASREGTEFLLC